MIKRHSYIVPDLVDGDVARAQAARRRDRDGESTIVHYHGSRDACNLSCLIYVPGRETRYVTDEEMSDD